MLSEEQVTEAFDKAKLNLGEPQLEMIFAYLKNKKIGIGQPGGTLEVGVQRTHGAVTGLSIGGPVRLAQTLTVTLTDAAAAPG